MVVKKWPLEYQMVTKTDLPSKICDSSDSNSSDSSDSCDSSDSSYQKTFFTQKKNFFFYL